MTSIDVNNMEQQVLTEDIPTNEFSRKLVDSMNKQVRLVDSDNGLDLFCYIKCDSTDSDVLKKCRGVVFNGDKVVMNGFPYTYEYTEDDANIEPIFDQCSFYDSYEGSLIRMFYFDDRWYTSTNRKLDANKSKWSSIESFGHYFKVALEFEVENNEKLRSSISGDDSKDIVERFQSTLNTNHQYMFLLLNNEQNRIVCDSPKSPTVFHVGTFIDGTLSMEENINIPYPRQHHFEKISELYDYINSIDIHTKQGVILFAPNNVQYKIYNREYYDLYKVRGNEPSIKFRYLQVRMDKRYNNLLHYLYPTSSNLFDEYENSIYAIGKKIYQAYFDRFIKNEYITVPTEEFAVIRVCHAWHQEDRVNNKISLNKVMEILNMQTPTQINRMIRKLYLDKQSEEEGENKVRRHKPNQDGEKRHKYKPLLNRNKQRSESVGVESPVVETHDLESQV